MAYIKTTWVDGTTPVNAVNLNHVETQYDQIEAEVQALVSGSPKDVYATLAALEAAIPTGDTNIYLVIADGNWYYWDGSAWTAGGTYQSTGIADGSITPVKLSFLPVQGVESDNLFDKSTVTYDKYIDYASGAVATSVTDTASDYIPVESSTRYAFKYSGQLAYYDVNKTYISGSVAGQYITTPETAKYIRKSTLIVNLDTQQCEIGAVNTAYVSHLPKATSNTIDIVEVKTKMIDFQNVVSKNLFNKIANINGFYIDYATGNLSASAANSVSDYTPVLPNTAYKFSKAGQLCYFTSAKAYIAASYSTGLAITTPATCYFIRKTTTTTDLPTQQLELGTVTTEYMTYDKKIGIDYLDIPALATKLGSINTTIIVAKTGGNYSTIQNAIDNAGDTSINPVTILVKNGTYEEQLVVNEGDRNLSIIGEDKDKCIILSQDGRYEHCPLMVSSSLYFANLQFIANALDNPELTDAERTSYAVHCDYPGTGYIIFENCILHAEDNAALGSGLHQDQKIELRNCQLISHTQPGTAKSDYGALFCHSDIGAGTTAQVLKVVNCEVRTDQSYAAYIHDVGGGDGMTATFINTMLWSETLGKTGIINKTLSAEPTYGITFTDDSYGNNVAELNKP